jgi:hypothetical protein
MMMIKQQEYKLGLKKIYVPKDFIQIFSECNLQRYTRYLLSPISQLSLWLISETKCRTGHCPDSIYLAHVTPRSMSSLFV